MTQTSLVALIVPAFVVCFGLLWSAIVFLSARMSGWASLARHYPGAQPPVGQSWHWTSAQFGFFASYRNVLTIVVSPLGLYLRPVVIFRIGHEPLLIPWNAISSGRRTNLFFTQAYRVEVRDPGSTSSRRITFYGKGLADALEAKLGS